LCGRTLETLSEMLYHTLFLQLLLNPTVSQYGSIVVLDIILTAYIHLAENLLITPLNTIKKKLDSSQELLQAKINNAKTNYETNLIATSDNSNISEDLNLELSFYHVSKLNANPL